MPPTKFIILTTLAFFLCGGLAFAGGLGLGFGLSDALKPTPTATPEPTPEPTPVAAYEPVERPAPREELALEEDFSGSSWEVFADSDHRKGYEEEQYFIAVESADYSFWSVAGRSFADLVLEVETYQVDGPDNNDYGVILRYQDDDNFYSFEISGDGYYTFGKAVDGQYYSIIPWRESTAINLGQAANMLRVEAVGRDFTFYINDELVDAAIDAQFSQGDIGLLAGTYEEAGTHVSFDNLKVWEVSE
ncbi:MAG: hypothetical protein L6R45_24955 [Anaerolineae bacterium]|nr:hypothetical protein [Anaerolineae bacterium]